MPRMRRHRRKHRDRLQPVEQMRRRIRGDVQRIGNEDEIEQGGFGPLRLTDETAHINAGIGFHPGAAPAIGGGPGAVQNDAKLQLPASSPFGLRPRILL